MQAPFKTAQDTDKVTGDIVGEETKWRLIVVNKRTGLHHRLIAEGTEELGENEELVVKLPDTTLTLTAHPFKGPARRWVR